MRQGRGSFGMIAPGENLGKFAFHSSSLAFRRYHNNRSYDAGNLVTTVGFNATSAHSHLLKIVKCLVVLGIVAL